MNDCALSFIPSTKYYLDKAALKQEKMTITVARYEYYAYMVQGLPRKSESLKW
jgi:hypothetical protein